MYCRKSLLIRYSYGRSYSYSVLLVCARIALHFSRVDAPKKDFVGKRVHPEPRFRNFEILIYIRADLFARSAPVVTGINDNKKQQTNATPIIIIGRRTHYPVRHLVAMPMFTYHVKACEFWRIGWMARVGWN